MIIMGVFSKEKWEDYTNGCLLFKKEIDFIPRIGEHIDLSDIFGPYDSSRWFKVISVKRTLNGSCYVHVREQNIYVGSAFSGYDKCGWTITINDETIKKLKKHRDIEWRQNICHNDNCDIHRRKKKKRKRKGRK